MIHLPICSGQPAPSLDLYEMPKVPRKLPELDECLPETLDHPLLPRSSELADILVCRGPANLLTLNSTQFQVVELCRLNRGLINAALGVTVVGKDKKPE